MATKKPAKKAAKKAPAKKAGAAAALTEKKYRWHFTSHRQAMAEYDNAMDSPKSRAASNTMAEAIARMRATRPEDAAQIADAMQVITDSWSDACQALIDALYHECCKRSLATNLVKGKQSAKKARQRWKNDPKGIAMANIRAEWERRDRPGAAFAREMAAQYQQSGLDLSEGGIKNAIGEWRKEEPSS